jgi:hypothetical protein
VALLHRAELHPTKLELLSLWLPQRPWYRGPAVPDLNRVVAFRFDDPGGEVGIETLLVRADDGPLWQAPLTYRAAPVDGLEPWLLGTAEHSVLGTRWIYDGCADPVYASALAGAIVTGDGQAEEFVDIDGQLHRREPSMRVAGSGSAAAPAVEALADVVDEDPTVIVADSVELAVLRVLGDDSDAGGLTLTGTWDGQSTPLLLARAAVRTG